LLHIGSVVWFQQFLRSRASSVKCSRLPSTEAEESRVVSDIDLIQAGYRNISTGRSIVGEKTLAAHTVPMQFNLRVMTR
jgi:hypothetical protein